jgi:hypothetical protein
MSHPADREYDRTQVVAEDSVPLTKPHPTKQLVQIAIHNLTINITPEQARDLIRDLTNAIDGFELAHYAEWPL